MRQSCYRTAPRFESRAASNISVHGSNLCCRHELKRRWLLSRLLCRRPRLGTRNALMVRAWQCRSTHPCCALLSRKYWDAAENGSRLIIHEPGSPLPSRCVLQCILALLHLRHDRRYLLFDAPCVPNTSHCRPLAGLVDSPSAFIHRLDNPFGMRVREFDLLWLMT